MNIKEMEVTPDMALKWMTDHNVHNRKLRQSVVERYARDMKERQWPLTHEPIAFDEAGTIIDGQHRLWAVVESGTPTRFMVATNADIATQAVIDSGLSRTMVDRFKLAHGRDGITNAEISVAKALVQGKTRGTMTPQEVVAAYDTHEKAIQFAVNAFAKKVRAVTVVPVFTVVARAWYTQDKDRLTRFADVMTTGAADLDEPGEHSILLLRNWLLEKAPTKGGQSREATIYAKTERALSAFLLDEQLSILYGATSELFPLPIEKVKPRKAASRHTKTIQRRVAGARA